LSAKRGGRIQTSGVREKKASGGGGKDKRERKGLKPKQVANVRKLFRKLGDGIL